MKKNPSGVAMLMLASFIWGTALVAQSAGAGYMGPFTFNAVRFAIGGLSLLPVALLLSCRRGSKEHARESARGPLLRAALCCGTACFAATAFQQIGIAYTTAGKAGFITALYIMIVPLLGIFIGKKVPHLVWGCIATAIAGMYLLCINESFVLGRGDAFVLLCAFSTAIHILFVDKFSPLVDGVKLSCLQFLVCGTLSVAGALLFERPELSAILAGWVPLLYTGILSCGVAFTLQILGQKGVDPTLSSLILSLESVFAVAAGWLVLGETLTLREVAGCVLIFVAIVAAQIPSVGRKETLENP